MMMYNPDYVNGQIEFDQMDIDENDEIHLKMVEENKAVENQLYPNWMKEELMMMVEYFLDLDLQNHQENYLIDPIR